MRISLKIGRLISAIVLLCIVIPVFAQTQGADKLLSFEQLTGRLEKQFNIRLCYRPEWLDMKFFNPAILKLSLREVLSGLKKETGFSITTFDSVTFVFLPVKDELLPVQERQSPDVILIGNPDESGKYNKAVIRGRILNGTDGSPVTGASVFLDKSNIGSVSDKLGAYQLRAPVGEYTLRAKFLGFDEEIRKIRLVGNGFLDIKIYEEAIKLPEVVITSERPSINVTGAQISFIRFGKKEIKELPVTLGSTDIIKSVVLLPGVQTIGEFGTGFNVRGGSSDQNLVLLEGMPLFNSSHLFGLISVVNSDGVSDVTLVKAGINARYGERVSSVLDIRLGADDQYKRIVNGGISLMDGRIYVQNSLAGNRLSFLMSARSSYSDWLLHKVPDVDLMNSSAGFYDVNALLTWNINPSNKLNLFGYASDDQFGFARSTDYKYGNLLASVKLRHTFSRSLHFEIMAGISNYGFDMLESDTLSPWESYKISSAIKYKKVGWDFSWIPSENHSVDFGLNGILYTVNPGNLYPSGSLSDVKPLRMKEEKAGEFSFYITDNFNLTGHLMLDLGLRQTVCTYLGPATVYTFRAGLPKTRQSITDSSIYNKNEIAAVWSALEPRISLRYGIAEDRSLKLSYNRTHQYINLISNTAVMNPSDIWKLCSPNLKPVSCDQLAAGYFRNFKSNSVESSAEVYLKRINNAIDYKNGARLMLNQYIEADLLSLFGINYGIELYARKNSGALTGWISYSYSRSLQKTKGRHETEKINDNHFFPSSYDKPNNLVINLNYHLSKRWRLGGTFTYSTGRPVTLPEYKFNQQGFQMIYYSDRNKYRLPDYHRLDIFLTYDKSLKLIQKWKSIWTFSVINLYGRKNAYSVFYKKEEHMVSTQYRMYDTYMLYIIGRPFPTLTYSFSF